MHGREAAGDLSGSSLRERTTCLINVVQEAQGLGTFRVLGAGSGWIKQKWGRCSTGFGFLGALLLEGDGNRVLGNS